MSITETEEPTISPDDDLSQQLATLRTERNVAVTERDALQLRLGELRAELEILRDKHNVQVASLQQWLDDLRTEHTATERRLLEKAADLEDFKGKVVEVAGRYADKHNWCSTVSEALAELGLQLPSRRYQATLQITVRFSAETTDRRDLPEEDWVYDSIRRGDLQRAIENNFQLDSDHSSSTVDDVEFEVTDVSEHGDD